MCIEVVKDLLKGDVKRWGEEKKKENVHKKIDIVGLSKELLAEWMEYMDVLSSAENNIFM